MMICAPVDAWFISDSWLSVELDKIYVVCVCVHLLVKVFAKPPDEQEPEIFFISMMYLVIAVGCGIATFLTVRNAQY